MEQNHNEPQQPLATLPAIRHDGWTGEAMATFLEALAETGVVAEACNEAGKSGTAAYALRRRNPLFAEAWEAALSIARERLADTLLARSLEGNVEQVWRDGEVIAEKHFLDNRLGLAVLRRLDQRADRREGNHSPSHRSPVRPERSRGAPDWDVAITALRTGKMEDIADALAMLKGGEVDEVYDPSIPVGQCQLCAAELDDDLPDPPIHCWVEEDEWWTNFPPPQDFMDEEVGEWGTHDYKRHCTDEELVLLEAERRLIAQERQSEAEAARDRWFTELRDGLEADGGSILIAEIGAALAQAQKSG